MQYVYDQLYREGWFQDQAHKEVVAYNLQKAFTENMVKYFKDIKKHFPNSLLSVKYLNNRSLLYSPSNSFVKYLGTTSIGLPVRGSVCPNPTSDSSNLLNVLKCKSAIWNNFFTILQI